jgi:hypothetical protein
MTAKLAGVSVGDSLWRAHGSLGQTTVIEYKVTRVLKTMLEVMYADGFRPDFRMRVNITTGRPVGANGYGSPYVREMTESMLRCIGENVATMALDDLTDLCKEMIPQLSTEELEALTTRLEKVLRDIQDEWVW